MTNLGFMYGNGMAVPKDEREAFNWFQKAAKLNEPKAMMHIGTFYLRGLVVPKDNETGIFWLQRSARLGCADAQQLLKQNNLTW
jgi:TPR repeat protein